MNPESMTSMLSQSSEEYPVMPEEEWLVVFLHPETLFSIFCWALPSQGTRRTSVPFYEGW